MKRNILIADDEKINLHLLEKYLLSDGDYRVQKALDGRQVIEAAQKFLPEVILLDWNMPILTAPEIIKEIRNSSNTHNIPIIVISNDFDNEKIEKILKLGAFDILKKPIDKTELKIRTRAAVLYNDALKEVEFQQQRLDVHIDELNKLSLIVKQTDNAVLIIDTDGNIEWANEGFTRMYGLSLQDFVSRYGSNIIDISFSPETIKEKLDELYETGKSTSYTSHIKNFNTIKEKWIQTTLTPIFNEHNEIEKIVAIETDITQLKLYEKNLEEKNRQMQELMEKLKETNKELQLQKELIQEEREKTDKLLESILPHHVASQLKSIGYARTRNYKMATIMFTDFKGFTKSCEHLKPDEIVQYLDRFFTVFDDIVVNHFIEKIKTIGDAYMCVGGIPLRNRSNPFDVILAALEIQNFMNHLDEFDPKNELPRWQIRLGIHTGPLVAGVVGKIKFAYDVWGDSVNIASRMESAGEVGRVNISGATYEKIKDFFECEYRGEIPIKNRGKMAMYFVNRIKPEYAEDEAGVFPNEGFKKFLHSL